MYLLTVSCMPTAPCSPYFIFFHLCSHWSVSSTSSCYLVIHLVLTKFIILLQLAKKFHPDTNKDDADAEKKFQEVNRAYEVWGSCRKCSYLSWTIVHVFSPKCWYYLYICQVLKDDDKREIYDQVIAISLFNETKIVMLLEYSCRDRLFILLLILNLEGRAWCKR